MHLVLFFCHFEFKNVNYKKDVNKNKELFYQQIDERLFIQVNFLLIENFIHVYDLP